MDIVLILRRRGIVKDVAHIRNVEAACGNVGSNQQLQIAIAETVQRLRPVSLRQVAMDRGSVEAVFVQRLGDDVDIALAVTEDDAVLHLARFNNAAQRRALRLVVIAR